MKNKKVIISAIALLVIAGIVIVKTTFFYSKSDADETYYVVEDEDTEYDGEEITTDYLPNEVVDESEDYSGDDVEYFVTDEDPTKNMPYELGSEENFIPLD